MKKGEVYDGYARWGSWLWANRSIGFPGRLQINQSEFASTLSPLLQAAGQRVGRRPPRRSIVNPAGAGQRDGGGVLGDGQRVGGRDREKSGGWSHRT